MLEVKDQILCVVPIPECPLKPGATLNRSQKLQVAQRERIVKKEEESILISFFPRLR